MRSVQRFFAVVIVVASVSGSQELAGAETKLVDHHVHILGPGLLRDWQSLGVPFSREDSAYTSAARLLDADGALEGAILVPMAHLYGNEEFRRALSVSEESNTNESARRTTTSPPRHGSTEAGP